MGYSTTGATEAGPGRAWRPGVGQAVAVAGADCTRDGEGGIDGDTSVVIHRWCAYGYGAYRLFVLPSAPGGTIVVSVSDDHHSTALEVRDGYDPQLICRDTYARRAGITKDRRDVFRTAMALGQSFGVDGQLSEALAPLSPAEILQGLSDAARDVDADVVRRCIVDSYPDWFNSFWPSFRDQLQQVGMGVT